MFKAALYYMDLDTIEYEGKGTSSNPYVTRNMSFKNKGLEMTYEKDFGSKYSYSLGANFCNPMGKNKKGVWERKLHASNTMQALNTMMLSSMLR